MTELGRGFPIKWLRELCKFANTCEPGDLLQDAEARNLPDEESVHAQLVSDLDVVVSGAQFPQRELSRLVTSANGVGYRLVSVKLRTREIFWAYDRISLQAFVSLLTLLLYYARRDETSWPGDLHRCELATCQNFFWTSDLTRKRGTKGGRPNVKFCSPKHGEKHHNLLSVAKRQKSVTSSRSAKHK